MTTSLLSHYLDESSPGYGGQQGLKRKQTRCMCAGDTSNNEEWILSNHFGTHIDAPRHFDRKGKGITEYAPDFFVFENIKLVDIPCEKEYLLSNSDLEKLPDDQKVELILFRTGFEKIRGEEDYWNRNPGFKPETAEMLRLKYPRLRMIGFDFISLTSFQNRELGREAHRQFLAHQKPILIIEDMKLGHLKEAPKRIIVSPLMVEKADGGPVTVFAFDT